jgi:hypothetical protein
MATKPKPTEDKRQAIIQNCSIVNTSAANEHTRAAVEALAHAAKANADAIAAIADGLKGSPATMDHGIYLSNVNPV